MPGYDFSINKTLGAAGKNFPHQQTINAPRHEGIDEAVPVAKNGTLTTRSSGTAGTATMDSTSHGINTGDKLDLYWLDADGKQQMCRGATAGSVSGASVPFTGASGTALPAASTVIQAAVVQVYSIDIVGDNLAALMAGTDFAACQIVLIDSGGPTELLVINLPGGESYEWAGEFTNPLAGDTCDTVHMTHNDLVTVRSVRVSAGLTA